MDLNDERLKSATRHKFDAILSFNQLLVEVRVVEQELQREEEVKGKMNKAVKSSSMAINSSDNYDELMKMVKDLSLQMEQMQKKVNRLDKSGAGNSHYKPQTTRSQDKSDGQSTVKKKIRCYKCGHLGHVQNRCRVDPEDYISPNSPENSKESLNQPRPVPRDR